MAISSYVGAEITPANSTFQSWLSKTNDLIGDMGSVVISVGNNNIGNTNIQGILSANTIVAVDELRGGTEASSGELVISSDLSITGSNTTISSNTFSASGDVHLNGATETFLVDTISTTINSANASFTGYLDLNQVVITGDTLGVPTGNTSVRPSPASAGMFRYNTELETFEGYDGTEWGLIGGGGGLSSAVVSSNYNASAEEYIFADTGSGTFTITLPASGTLEVGDIVKIAGKNWSINNLLISLNGSTLEGFTDDLALDIEDSMVELIWDGTTWQLFTNVLSSTGGGSAGLPQIISTNYGATSGDFIYADTTSSSFTVTLPATPALGDIVKLVGEYWSVNNLTVGRNGNTIDNTAEDLIVDVDGVTIELIWEGTTWAIFTNISSGGSIEITDTVANTEFTMPLIDGTANSYSSVSSANNITFNPSSGTLTVTDVNTLSDVSVKENIISIDDSINKLMELNPVEFTWKNNGIKSYGLIAQELEAVFPELVNETNDKKYVNYIPMIAMLLEGYKDLSNKIKELENK